MYIKNIDINNKKDLNDFINIPFELYKNNPYWVGELKKDIKHLLTKDPFWAHAQAEFFVAYKDKKPVGRIAAIINFEHNLYWAESCGMFGFFDCINDKEVSEGLFYSAASWLKEKGMACIRGPFNPSTNHTCGLAVDSFEQMPAIMMPYNYEYYAELIEADGFKKVKDLLAFERTKEDNYSPRLEKILARVRKKDNLKIRPVNVKNINEEIKIVQKIYNASWAKNWGFLPINDADIQETAKQLVQILEPRVTGIAEFEGEPAAFYISIPNMNHVLKPLKGSLLNPFNIIKALSAWKKIKDCRTLMLGVLPEYRGKGIELAMIAKFIDDGIGIGWHKSELGWILENNKDMITVLLECGCRQTKRYRIYEKSLG
ncbi:hypothetical protein Dip518_001212 [Parelusimicrobium proximum]|uniref:N-acetyltransferase n=1 Tax=Parelusimicrobium proximum TaxID=3228953 RepID=UPI003D165221